MRLIRRTPVLRIREEESSAHDDELAVEEPLEIRIAGDPVSVTMRTPGHDLELVAGLLLSERLIAPGVRPLLRQPHPNVVSVARTRLDAVHLEHARHASAVTAACGLCGKASVESVHQHFPPIEDDLRLTHAAVHDMRRQFDAAQPVFARTGGTHAAALFDPAGALLVAREDIGRHNAVDKVIGYAVLHRLVPLKGCTLLVSGRASFEIVQKGLGAAIPAIAAVSAPSSLAVELASGANQTLIGFLRPDRFNVYCGRERVFLMI